MDFKEEIAKAINKIVKNAELEVPSNPELGDYALPCFPLAKELKKNPVEIAKDLAKKIPKIKGIEKIVPTGPYVNFFVEKTYFAKDTLDKIQKEKNNYGKQKLSSEKVMIEFSQANTHKAFHVGHIRGTSLGESIARIMEFCGNKVIRANYQGDIGMHVAKWIWCYKRYHSKEKLRKDESWIASIYVDAVKKLTEKPELQDEVDEINRKLEERDKGLYKLWQDTRKGSLDSFEIIYKELNTKFDEYFFESQLDKRAKDIVNKLVKGRIAEISDGATIINFEKYNMGVWVLLRADGTVLYSAKDLALAEKKFKEHKIDKAVYVVGSEQRLHVMQIFKTLELMRFKQAKNCHYVPVNEVRLPEGKMSSRTGTNILYSDFKKEMVEYASEKILERNKKIDKKELSKRALAIAIASLKYSMLKQDTNKGIIFNKEESLRFEGDTGPYLLYSYARAKSILKKAKYNAKKKYDLSIEPVEKELIMELSRFPEVIVQAYNNISPNEIANYSSKLAQKFNEFYHAEKVIGSDKEQFRLVLVDSFSQVLKNCLYLLGIPVIEEM
ncbi:TPA: arginine--tRNA ligase [Candidatus Woesearchaeota archaeon]|nr:arginine--tRNA ligase [Candidatus Woesearchaeota archaeon]HIH39620.1 arginine--tRNA ligase [Candidatus Woesearchaeota archaeon]